MDDILFRAISMAYPVHDNEKSIASATDVLCYVSDIRDVNVGVGGARYGQSGKWCVSI